MKRLSLIGFALLLGTFNPGAAQASPSTLTLADLVNRPDRWPDSISMPGEMRFRDGFVVHPGDRVIVGMFDGSRVGLIAAGNHRFAASPAACHLLEAANQAWASLTPAQRAVDPVSLAANRALWPLQVTTNSPIRCQWGTLAPGTTVGVVAVSAHDVNLRWPDSARTVNVNFADTDVFARARQLASVPPAKRPSPIAAALQGVMVDADGQAYRDARLEDKQYFVFYFGASWCAPCHAFSPTLVKYLEATLPKHPELEAVFLSDDKAVGPMYAYMKEEKMPMPAVPPQAVNQSPLLVSYAANTIPQLVVVDRFGRVLATNDDNHGHRVDPEDTLGALSRILASPPATE